MRKGRREGVACEGDKFESGEVSRRDMLIIFCKHAGKHEACSCRSEESDERKQQ